MADQFEYDVFLSHSSKDKAVVRPLAERLRADGLKVWFDEWVLKPGNHLQKKIDDGLEESRVLVLCMSEYAGSPVRGVAPTHFTMGMNHSGQTPVRPQTKRGGSGAKLDGAVPSWDWSPSRVRSLRGSRGGSGPEKLRPALGGKLRHGFDGGVWHQS